ncbi:hypothetical protein Dsin_014537, partial [Dipteronia sinensis]
VHDDWRRSARLWYPGSEIPKCFDFRSMGSFINVELPPNWFNNNFLGFTVCVVVSDYDHPIDFEAKCTDYNSSDDICVMGWKCNFKSKDGHQFVSKGTEKLVVSNHVFVFSIFPYSHQELICSENEVSFEFYHDSSSQKIEKCGVHLMFKEDTRLIKMVKAVCVLSLALQVYFKEVFLLKSVRYLSVNGLDLAWWSCPLRS